MTYNYRAILPEIIDCISEDERHKQEIIKLLNSYNHNEPERVKIGILKASNGDIDKIQELLEIANCDFRDLLCITDYPLSSKKWNLKEKNPKKYKELQNQESTEYANWINKNSKT